MRSPFPGMNPYLEGYLWSDVHNALASKIRQQLTPKLRPRYTARLEVYVVEDSLPESEIGILYPDVEVMRVTQRGEVAENPFPHGISSSVSVTPAPLTLPVFQPVSVRLVSIEIRDTAKNILVTCIEILSPVNKREPGLSAYRQKRQRLYQAGVHLIELDLLRRGTRPFAHPRMPDVPYAIALTRSQSGMMEVWPLRLQDSLPIIPVPLRSPDPDVPLELPQVLADIYEEAAYDLSIDYSQPPPPPILSEDDTQWMHTLLSQYIDS
ncbi:MAG TPA: hypothetical protein DD379_10810 [Cyanobacteria bacterium UBA11162]|nr:hypothetical protein [Cyanobacteria bacterium UBA11162]